MASVEINASGFNANPVNSTLIDELKKEGAARASAFSYGANGALREGGTSAGSMFDYFKNSFFGSNFLRAATDAKRSFLSSTEIHWAKKSAGRVRERGLKPGSCFAVVVPETDKAQKTIVLHTVARDVSKEIIKDTDAQKTVKFHDEALEVDPEKRTDAQNKVIEKGVDELRVEANQAAANQQAQIDDLRPEYFNLILAMLREGEVACLSEGMPSNLSVVVPGVGNFKWPQAMAGEEFAAAVNYYNAHLRLGVKPLQVSPINFVFKGAAQNDLFVAAYNTRKDDPVRDSDTQYNVNGAVRSVGGAVAQIKAYAEFQWFRNPHHRSLVGKMVENNGFDSSSLDGLKTLLNSLSSEEGQYKSHRNESVNLDGTFATQLVNYANMVCLEAVKDKEQSVETYLQSGAGGKGFDGFLGSQKNQHKKSSLKLHEFVVELSTRVDAAMGANYFVSAVGAGSEAGPFQAGHAAGEQPKPTVGGVGLTHS